jgi:prepilin-type N-terminal cleavage/methylation domain-containing protein
MRYLTSQSQKHTKGFTLVETLVAITVLLLVIVGPISAAQKGIQRAYYANEQLSAVFIAQQTIESVRQLRDDQALVVWQGGGDTWDWSADTACKSEGCPFAPEVVKDNITFTREVEIQDDGDRRSVTVTISWENTPLFGEDTPTVVLQTYLYDHYQRFE